MFPRDLLRWREVPLSGELAGRVLAVLPEPKRGGLEDCPAGESRFGVSRVFTDKRHLGGAA